MEFRWIALIALWTLLSGPILGTPSGPAHGDRPTEIKAVQMKAKQPARR
jgi:hypothetical protein